MKNENELIAAFNKAYGILSISVLRARMIREQASNMKYPKSSVKRQIDYINKKYWLEKEADRVEARGRAVWALTTDFQGKYVGWRHLTENNNSIFELTMNISKIYEPNFKQYQKAAKIKY